MMAIDINERIDLLIKELEMNVNSFSNALEINSTVIYNIVGRRKSKPSYELLEKIVASFDVSPIWLLTGKGGMLLRKDGYDHLSGHLSDHLLQEETGEYGEKDQKKGINSDPTKPEESDLRHTDMPDTNDPETLQLHFRHQQELNTVLSRENQALMRENEALQEIIRLYRRGLEKPADDGNGSFSQTG